MPIGTARNSRCGSSWCHAPFARHAPFAWHGLHSGFRHLALACYPSSIKNQQRAGHSPGMRCTPTRYGSWPAPIIVDEGSNSEEVGFAWGLRLMPS